MTRLPYEIARKKVLHRNDILDCPPDKAFDRHVRLAARYYDVPVAFVSLVDPERQWFMSCIGLSPAETSRDASICAHVVDANEVSVVPDTVADPRFSADPFVTGPPRLRFYAGAPLRTSDGLALGALAIADVVPRPDPPDLDALVELASLASDELELRHAAQEHARAEQALRAQSSAVQELAQLLDLIDDSVITLDHDGVIRYWNGGAERTYGWSREEAIGKVAHELLQTQFPEPREVITQAVRDRGGWQGELVHATRDARRIVVNSRWALRRAEEGRRSAVLEINTDITMRKEAEQAMALARAQAERANRAKSEFLSRMSHELRTPLNAILGFAQLLEIDDLRPDQREGVGEITRAARHLLDLINEVLDLSRIEAGTMTLSQEPVRLSDTVAEVLGMVSPLAATRHLRLVNHIPVACDLHVRADQQRLKQVLINFVTNAIKYNREHGEVAVRCTTSDGRVRVIVDDTGFGISDADRERLFLPFERLEPVTSTVEGTGLGLALSKRLVELMRGEVGVESRPGQGSSFWMELAAADAPSGGPAVLEVPADLGSHGGGQLRTVLYVEDNRANVKLVERILARRPDVRLVVAMEGAEALRMARQCRPNLILLDLHLPDMAGEAVLRRLRADPATADTPIAVVSADATPSQIGRLKSMGAAAYVTKPFDIAQVLALVDDLPGESPRSDHPGTVATATSPSLDSRIVAQLHALAGRAGDDEGLRDVITTFLEDAQHQIAKLRAALANGDLPAVRMPAHRLCGSSASLGAKHVADLCRRIETQAGAGEILAMPGSIDDLERALVEAAQALHDEFLS